MPELTQRQTTRLTHFDYSQNGAYFITLCTEHRRKCFGEIADDVMQLNKLGEMIMATWQSLALQIDYAELDQFVIMPNHFHAIVFIDNKRAIRELPLPNSNATVGAIHESPAPAAPNKVQNRRQMLLPKIIGRFKMQTSKLFNNSTHCDGLSLWQRNYHEHVIRNDADLTRLREYIVNNPLRWSLDRENPDNVNKT